MRKSRVRDFDGFIWYDLFMFESKKRVLPILLCLLSLASCGRCSEKVVTPLLENVPVDASLVVEIPNIKEAIRGFGLYVEQISRGQARPLVTRIRAALETQAGIQFFKPAKWTQAGLDVDAGLVFFIREDQKMLWLRTLKPEIFEKSLSKLLIRLDGATKKLSSNHFGVDVTTIGRPFGAEVVPVLHYAHTGTTYLLSFGGEPGLLGETIANQGKRKLEKKRWVDDVTMAKISSKVVNGAMRVMGRSGLAERILGKQAKAISDGVALSIQLGPTGLKVDGQVDFKLPGLEKLVQPSLVLEHARLLEDDAALIVLTDAARPEFLSILKHQPVFKEFLSSVRTRSLQETGLDLEVEALKHLKGPIALALHLQDITTLYQRLRAGERRMAVLLDSIQVAVVAEVSDVEAMEELVSKSITILGNRGMALRKREIKVGEKKAIHYEPDKPSARIGWGIAEKYYYYGAGMGRAEKIAKHLLDDKSTGAISVLQDSIAASVAKESGTQIAVLRTKVIAEALGLLFKQTKIPAIAKLGLAQQAKMILGLLAGLDDVVVGATVEPGAIVLKVRQRL